MTGVQSRAGDRPIRVLIVDDDPAVRRALRRFLESDAGLDVVGEADEPEAAIRYLETTEPDVCLVDLSLAGSDGLDLVRTIRHRGYPGRLLVLSVRPKMLYARKALQAGADGYITKSDAPEELLEAIHTMVGPHADPDDRRGAG